MSRRALGDGSALPAREIIVIDDSESESEPSQHASSGPNKKPRTGSHTRSPNMSIEQETRYRDLAPVSGPSGSQEDARAKSDEKNAHLKGRRRFKADLADLKEECSDVSGLKVHGLQARHVRAGDEDDSIEFEVLDKHAKHFLAMSLLVSDPSDYPKDHTFYSLCSDPDISPRVQKVIENVSTMSSFTIRATMEKLLSALSKVSLSSGYPDHQESQSQSQEIEMDDDDDSDAYDAFEYDEFGTGSSVTTDSNFQLTRLQQDFIDVIASEYRPGLVRFSDDDFALSVSVPVVTLTSSIPARALLAWDRRLLSRPQHLTLLISGSHGTFPVLRPDGTYTQLARQAGTALAFRVGLTARYRPGREAAQEAFRTFGLIIPDAEDTLRAQAEREHAEAMEEALGELAPPPASAVPEPEEVEDMGRFDKFSLSDSLESLLDHTFLKALQLRRKFKLGWAGAETLVSEMEKSQMTAEDVYQTKLKDIKAADKAEAVLKRTYELPHDPVHELGENDEINLPLTAFCYLIRRFTLCTRYCIVCHNPLIEDFESLKPYVCQSKLCAYQYYSMNRGQSLEYEIRTNPETVDLLVSLTYVAAAEDALTDPMPVGLGLRVPKPLVVNYMPTWNGMYSGQHPGQLPMQEGPRGPVVIGPDGMCDFDDLDIRQMRASIVELIDTLPSVEEMKRVLKRKVKPGKTKPRLRDTDPSVIPAAWTILRWCVASCTAHLEELTNPDECVRNLDGGWRQFRFSVGAPDAEAKFKTALMEAQNFDANAMRYPSLYAFHGSAVKNWHSIIRHGLWFKDVTNGRAFGDGVYLAKDASVSMGHYAAPSRSGWKNSQICPISCVALAEVVNLPAQFVSSSPYFVIKDTHWIMCRYLLVKSAEVTDPPPPPPAQPVTASVSAAPQIPLVKLDPAHPVRLRAGDSRALELPQPAYRLETLLSARRADLLDEAHDDEDLAVFLAAAVPQARDVIVITDDDDDGDYDMAPVAARAPAPPAAPMRPVDDWRHDEEWVRATIAHLMPPPWEASPGAAMSVQREFRAMLREQEGARALRELGWYLPQELVGDNLFQWVVEMHSFEPELPIAKDLKARNINSVIFEIRFPPNFPNAPPFFRIVSPRFLPFIQGGGGHVTGGGSICMDLLTSDGWLPSYSVSAVLLQIKLAISNLDPRPARLAHDYDRPYQVHEALEGFKRAAATHGWQVPLGTDRLFG